MGDQEIGKTSRDDSNRVENTHLGKAETQIGIKKASPRPSSMEESTYEKSVKSERERLTDPSIPLLVPIEFSIVTEYLNGLLPGIEKIAGKLMNPPTAIEEKLNKDLHDMGIALLKKWSEDIDETKKRIEESENSPAKKAQEDYIQYKKHLERMLQQVNTEGNTEKDTQVFELMAMFLIGTSLATIALSPVPIMSPEFSALSTIQQIQHVVMQIIPVDDLRAELGLIGALFAASTLYRTTWVTIAENQGKAEKNKNATFAKNYVKDIEKLVEGKKLDNFVSNTCKKLEREGKAVSEERLGELVAMVKLVHLVSAVSVVYWIETKHMTAEEIADMISGKMLLPEKDMRLPLLKLIQQQLALIPPKDKARVLGALLEYIDSKPKVDDLMEPSKVFDNLNSFISGPVRG